MEYEQSEQNCYIQLSNSLSCWSRLTCDTTKLQTLLRTEVIQSPQLKISVYGEEISCARLLMGPGFEASNTRTWGKPSQAESVDFMDSPCCHACQGAKFLRISTHRTRKAQKLNPRGAIDDHLLTGFRCFPRNVQIHVLTVWYMCFIWIYIEILSCNNEDL